MNKKTIISMLAITGLMIGFTSFTADAATTGTPSVTSNTGVDVAAGTLSITSAPDITFNSNVDDIANGANLTVSNSSSNTTLETTDDQGYGADTSWSLSAVPSELIYTGSDGKANTLKVASMTLNGTDEVTPNGTTSVNVTSGTNEGTTTTSLSKIAITLGKDQQVFGATYSGTINWTLTGNTGTIGGSSTSSSTTAPAAQ
ncbi:MAG: hypothetical protein ABF470_09915 [Liquorilactobacillus sp.]|uniref:hypothetical protein n=1 Tax=Liquorilactobacillus sp. TaxID=2767923 RepID=UPI0039E749F7